MARLEASEADHKEMLQHQVSQARTERSDAQKALANLTGTQQERLLTVEALRLSKSGLPAVFDTTDIEILRAEAVKCYQQLQTQSSLVEKLKAELELECQNVNALRTENQALRQMTVTMVRISFCCLDKAMRMKDQLF